MGIKYGSDESITVTEEIYKQLGLNSYKSSCTMAGERGAFPVFERELEENHPFIKRIMDASSEVKELYEKHGRRNIANTTTAPAGSVSILAQTTSGI
jgi:ribonucleoside-diphosphate reductase alpha chain